MNRTTITIERHGVPRGEDGLSPFQRRLIEEPTPIRICSAPTGAGKSYGFVRASVVENANVVFIVPTRRLAQNLARSLVDDLMDTGLSLEVAQSRLAIWTSDERARLEEEMPDVHIGRLRVRQMQFYQLPERGSFIIATPESIGYWLLNPPFAQAGSAPPSIYDILQRDHIVFDEFHTIEARGFGLAASICRIAAALSDQGHRCKVSFLSATPIAIRHTLEAFEVPSDKIVEFSEDVVSASGPAEHLRILHGDVDVVFEDAPDMRALCIAHQTRILETIARSKEGRSGAKNTQVVVLFDSLERLLLERDSLAEYFVSLGVPAEKIMRINSIDDGHVFETGVGGTRGRAADPLTAWILLATSSIEMGVTLHADVMITEAGFKPMSLVQRVGRVARGDMAGLVVVRSSSKAPWFKVFLNAMSKASLGAGVQRLSVGAFVAMALQECSNNFAKTNGVSSHTPTVLFDSLPFRAVWCAALFWVALDARHLRRGQKGSLYAFAPKKAIAVRSLLAQVLRGGRECRSWHKAFLWQARHMRSIEERVRVVTNTRPELVPYSMWARNPLLRGARIVDDGAGDALFSVQIYCSLEQALGTRDGGRPASVLEVLVPGVAQARSVPADPINAVASWEGMVKTEIQSCGSLDPRVASLESARTLVRMTRILPEPVAPTTLGQATDGNSSFVL